jgi:D-glycero-alpha-D-manno-heptose-7-phosphate kinase
VYTGQSRISSETITAVMDAYRKRDAGVLHALKQSRILAEQMADALALGNLETLGGLVREQWTHQRALHPAIPTPLIDDIIARSAEAGAIGAKALGASGGGCVLVIARHDRVSQVREAVATMGELIPFELARHGVEPCG